MKKLIRPIFKERSSCLSLSSKCLRGHIRKYVRKPLNDITWNTSPDSTYCSTKFLKAGVSYAVIFFNDGSE